MCTISYHVMDIVVDGVIHEVAVRTYGGIAMGYPSTLLFICEKGRQGFGCICFLTGGTWLGFHALHIVRRCMKIQYGGKETAVLW